MKRCFKCGIHYPLTGFYAHPNMADGHLNKCKACSKSDTMKHKERASSDPKWVVKESERHRLKSQKYREDGRVSPVSNSSKRATQISQREKYPERNKARAAVARALRTGKLNRHPCAECGSKAQAHHSDYSKPLDVIWLCTRHHAEVHVKDRRSKILGLK